MRQLLEHGFKINEDDIWIVFKKKISEYKYIKVYQNKAWSTWSCELIQNPFSEMHDEKTIILNSKSTFDWVLKTTQILEEAGNIF